MLIVDVAEVLATKGEVGHETDGAQAEVNVMITVEESGGAEAEIEDRAKGMLTGIEEGTLVIGKLSTVTNAINVIDTPEGTARPPDLHPDVDIDLQAPPPPPHHHHHPLLQENKDLERRNILRSQKANGIHRYRVTIITSPANILASLKASDLIRAGTGVQVKTAQMNMLVRNRPVPKRKNARGKNERKKKRRRFAPFGLFID
jgi:hypothetical protein